MFKRMLAVSCAVVLWTYLVPWQTQAQAPVSDTKRPTTQLVTVEKDVDLEVLDWGGKGPALVLLAGLGNTAHIFDNFAPRLTQTFHVYGITRRGFGASTSPQTGYSATRLGDDVVAVLDKLRLPRCILVGHSIAGEELSSVATRFPARVLGLVYLDAAAPFAYQNPAFPDNSTTFNALGKEGSTMAPPAPPSGADLASFSAYREWLAKVTGVEFPESDLRATITADASGRPLKAKGDPATPEKILNGEQRFDQIPVPALAIYAIPHSFGTFYDALPAEKKNDFAAKEVKALGTVADEFQLGNPGAYVVRIAHANHYVFISNETEVLSALYAFTNTLQVNR